MTGDESERGNVRLLGKSEATPLMAAHQKRTVTIWSLVAISYFSVAGGPEGTETIIQNGGAGYAVLGIAVIGLVWSIPTALMTAELSTMFPENGGYTLWVSAAFGPRMGKMAGWLQFISSAVDAALYPALFLSYFKAAAGLGDGAGAWVNWGIKSVFIGGMFVLNLSGINNVGHGSVGFMLLLLAPFVVVIFIAFTGAFTGETVLGWEFNTANWYETPTTGKWSEFLMVLLWNMGYWEGASVCAGEIENVSQTFPKALAIVFVIVVANYVLPILAFSGLDNDWAAYDNGYYITIIRRVGGAHWAIVLGAAQCFSAAGLYTSGIVKNGYQLCGMAEQGMLPSALATRLESTGAPWLALTLCVAITLAFLPIERFEMILAVDMNLYCAALLLEIAALLRLRTTDPDRERPYRIGAEDYWLYMLFLPAVIVSMFGVFWASWEVLLLSLGLVVAGVAIIGLLERLRQSHPEWFEEGSGVMHVGDSKNAAGS
ncbi:amino acid/polyamine transporter I [Baffinella frigidus]|nr:amino acid/polyamine transporter I [Cryptophyta sp. CCMP2293]